MNPPPLNSKRIVKRIAPLQLGKILAILYGAMGLLALPFFFIAMLVASHMQTPQRGVFAFIGVGMAFLLPIFYACMGFVVGVVGAAIYNVIAKWVGGIEVEVE
jgi:hypothetical protein